MLTHLHPLLDLPPPPLNLFPSFVFGVQPPLPFSSSSLPRSIPHVEYREKQFGYGLLPPHPSSLSSLHTYLGARRIFTLPATLTSNWKLHLFKLRETWFFKNHATSSSTVLNALPSLPPLRSSLFNPPAKPKRHDDRCKFLFFSFFCATLACSTTGSTTESRVVPFTLLWTSGFRFSSRFFVGTVKKLSVERFAILATVESARDFFFSRCEWTFDSGDRTVLYVSVTEIKRNKGRVIYDESSRELHNYFFSIPLILWYYWYTALPTDLSNYLNYISEGSHETR